MNRALSLTCPHCFASLWLADRAFVGKQAGCPQCEGAIHIAAAGPHGAQGVIPSANAAAGPLLHGVLQSAAAAPPAEDNSHSIASEQRVAAPSPATRAAAPAAKKRRAATPARPDSTVGQKHSGRAKFRNHDGQDRPSSSLPANPDTTAAPAAIGSAPVIPPTLSAGPAAPSAAAHWIERLKSPSGLGVVVAATVLIVIVALAGPWSGAPREENTDRTAGRSPTDGNPAGANGHARVEGSRSTGGDRAFPSANGGHPPPATLTANDAPAQFQPGEAPPAGVAQSGDVSPPDRPRPPASVKPPSATIPVEVPGEATVAEIPTGPPPAAKKPPREPIDVAARLRVPFVKFDQSKPALVRNLLLEVEGMVGVPVKYDRKSLGPLAAGLDRSISFRLQNTTVGGILEAVVVRAGLAWDIDGETIRLRAP